MLSNTQTGTNAVLDFIIFSYRHFEQNNMSHACKIFDFHKRSYHIKDDTPRSHIIAASHCFTWVKEVRNEPCTWRYSVTWKHSHRRNSCFCPTNLYIQNMYRRWYGSRLNIKTPSYQYRNSHYEDMTVSRPSHLYNGSLLSRLLDIEMRPRIMSPFDLIIQILIISEHLVK